LFSVPIEVILFFLVACKVEGKVLF
jgi:hypothetical protein